MSICLKLFDRQTPKKHLTIGASVMPACESSAFLVVLQKAASDHLKERMIGMTKCHQNSAYSELMMFLSCGSKPVRVHLTVTLALPPMVQVKRVRS